MSLLLTGKIHKSVYDYALKNNSLLIEIGAKSRSSDFVLSSVEIALYFILIFSLSQTFSPTDVLSLIPVRKREAL